MRLRRSYRVHKIGYEARDGWSPEAATCVSVFHASVFARAASAMTACVLAWSMTAYHVTKREGEIRELATTDDRPNHCSAAAKARSGPAWDAYSRARHRGRF